MGAFQRALDVIRANRRPYIAINASYYGLVLCGMIVSALFPSLQEHLLAGIQFGLQTVSLQSLRRCIGPGTFRWRRC